ncbi:MAG: radical SAM protein [Proteobacteria bacterium]|nr:radical SAM protein [Pseudomonadota bacterium]
MKKKKVLLINSNTETAPYPVPPVGLCLVASSLSHDFDVHLYDGTFDGGRGLAMVIADMAPDYIGLGIRNIDDVVMENNVSYIDTIQRKFVDIIHQSSRAPLILGGAGYSLFSRSLLALFDADFGVIGEGEIAFPALLAALESNRDPSHIPGIIHRTTGSEGRFSNRPYRQKQTDPLFSNIDSFVDFTPYTKKGSYPIQTKRGCIHRCLYCSYPLIEGSSYRLRSPKSVVDEIEDAVLRLDTVTFEIVDSTLNDPLEHALAICQEIVARDLRVRLRSMGVNPGSVTRDLIIWMKKAGFVQIDCSADTASPAMLSSLRKGYDLTKLEGAAQLITEFDMPTMWFFILGGPGETAQTIDESFDFIDRFVNPNDMVHITEGLRIYPRTGLYNTALKEGVIDAADPLLDSVFYVSPDIGKTALIEKVVKACRIRPNCVRAVESTPSPEMIQQAMKLRQEQQLTEPMFRTFLRIRRSRMAGIS